MGKKLETKKLDTHKLNWHQFIKSVVLFKQVATEITMPRPRSTLEKKLDTYKLN